MEKDFDAMKDNKRQIILNVVAAVACLFCVGVCVAMFLLGIVQLFPIYIGLISLVPFAFVFVFYGINQKKKKAYKTAGITIMAVVPSIFAISFGLPFLLLYVVAVGLRPRDIDASSLAKIESVKDSLKACNEVIYNKSDKYSDFYYYDNEGKIVDYFRKMTMTEYDYTSWENSASDYFFRLDSGCTTVNFNHEFTSIHIFVEIDSTWDSDTAKSEYSLIPEEGQILKSMLEEKVESQYQTYKEKEAEVTKDATYQNAIASLQQSSRLYTYIFEENTKEKENYTTCYKDDKREVLNALLNIDTSSLTLIEDVQLNYKGFLYESNDYQRDDKFALRIFPENQCLQVQMKYESDEHLTRWAKVNYTLSQDDCDRLMDVVNNATPTIRITRESSSSK